MTSRQAETGCRPSRCGDDGRSARHQSGMEPRSHGTCSCSLRFTCAALRLWSRHGGVISLRTYTDHNMVKAVFDHWRQRVFSVAPPCLRKQLPHARSLSRLDKLCPSPLWSGSMNGRVTRGDPMPRTAFLIISKPKLIRDSGRWNVTFGSSLCENADEPLLEATSCLVDFYRPGKSRYRGLSLYE